MHTNLVQVTTSRESQAVRCPGNIFFTRSCCTMKTCDETSQIQIRLTTATRHSGASPKERWKDLPRFCSCSPPSSHGYATTGMDLCCYVGVKYHKVRCLFLSSLEWKCSTGLVRASPVDPSCRDVGIASVQRSSRPESWAPALPGSVWKVTGDRCFTLAIAGVHAGKTEQCFIFIKNDMSLHW